ncbi:DNA modification methylase [Microbacterium sp. SORGH_AS_0888]|uniref:DNA modification methylase n=1 Tax=Microbacterium sp. SORGH_AS_0888 TaxID=3041791 RepID=UPI00278140A2|nr:DNA modification methylase [Microbacterium sp. SORGH_AS_0888]MDQ1131074.1 hypothetical protein [Microbacterium sp. SORGH_AS_0888]
MKSRLLASLAIGAAVVIGTTGCSMIAPQGTTVVYSPSDGLNVPNTSGPLKVRNVLIVANEDGSEGNLVAAIVNDTDSSAVLNIEVGEGAGAVTKTVRVAAGTTKSLGVSDVAGVENLEGAEPLLITGLDTPPGATVSVYFQSGDGAGARVEIPVLDGTLSHLSTLAP